MDHNPAPAVNPYIVGLPVPPRRFFGYQQQVRRFYQALNGDVLQPVRVLGMRRSGKTSFLRYLASGGGREFLSGPARRRDIGLVYIDLQRIQTPEEFYAQVIRGIWKKIDCPSDPPPERFPNQFLFEDWLGRLVGQSEQQNLVILLDEFDQLASKKAFSIDFFHILRSIACASDYDNRFTCVTASVRDILAISELQGDGDKLSPLWNIFLPTPVILGGFEWDEARELITKPAQSQRVTLSLTEVREIYRIAGKLPYFIQAVSSEWFQRKLQKVPLKEIAKQTISELSSLEQIQKVFSGYWGRLSLDQQTLLHDLAAGDPVETSIPQREYDQLTEYGLIEEIDEEPLVSGELFERFCAAAKPGTGDPPAGSGRAKPIGKTPRRQSSGIKIVIAGDVRDSTIVAGQDNEVE